MITIKYKGEIINPNDIEITWKEYGVLSDNDICVRTGNVEEYGYSRYSEGYDEGYDEGVYQE
jgi:hypothetical protein